MLTILISILEYAILAFLTYKLLENDKKIIVFLVNIIGPMLLAFIQNNLTGINIVSIIINGTLISFVCYFTYERYQDELNKYLSSPTLGKYASLLKDARPYIATKELLFLEYDLDLIANRVNLKNNQKTISNLIQKISGRQFFVYALTRAETIAYVKKFRDLSQLGKLKKADEVTLDLKEIK